MKGNSPLDSAVIAEGNEADNDGNEDEDCNDDDNSEQVNTIAERISTRHWIADSGQR